MKNKLTNCRTCEKEVSITSKTCPHCGEKKPGKKASKAGYIWLGLFALIFVFSRLESMAPKSSTNSSSLAPNANDWIVHREQSSMDDSATLKIEKDASAPVKAWLKEIVPALRIQCQEKKTNVLFIATDFTPVVGEFGKANFRIRIDEGKAFPQFWNESTDGEAAFAPDPINFLRKIQDANTLRIEFNPANTTLAQAEFSLTGLKPLLQEIAQTCGWKL